MTAPELTPDDALILVDLQNDFCPGGALAVAGGDEVVEVLNTWIEIARRGGARIVASRDWHPPDHASFREQGGPWPTHAVAGTPGAEFRSTLRLPPDAEIVSKGTERDRDCYSAFRDSGLAERLRSAGVRRVWIGGLALDVCVRETALDALREGFEVHLLREGSAPVDPEQGRATLKELADAGARIEPGEDHV